MNFEEVKIYNPGILSATLPKNVFDELQDSCQLQLKNKSFANSLKKNMFHAPEAQGIEETIHGTFPKSYIDFLCQFAKEYVEYFNIEIKVNSNAQVVNKWLNLQKQYEYRPLHKHNNGRGISFVTYIDIPYELNQEDKYPNHDKRSTIFRNGRIEFLYNMLNGQQERLALDIDKTYEGKTILFHNNLLHQVYPFYTTSDYRISVAGNIVFL